MNNKERSLVPAHKSPSNTSRMTKKLNESFKDSLRNTGKPVHQERP